MNMRKRLAMACFALTVCLGSASAQQFIIQKKRLVVRIEQNCHCPQGISISATPLGSRLLCADYPEGIADQLRKFVGSTVELEGLWTFLPGSTSNAPVALGTVSMIGPDRVNVFSDAHNSAGSATPPSGSRWTTAVSVKGVTPNQP